MKNAVLTLGGSTNAQRAKRLLARNGIYSRVVKLDFKGADGCTHGIEFNQSDFYSVVALLKEEGLKYSLYGGTPPS